MSFWKRLLGGATPRFPEVLNVVYLDLPGWNEEASRSGDSRFWHDSQGDVLSLSVASSLGQHEISNETSVQRFSRGIAEDRSGGLIEVRMVTGTLGATVSLIYKRLQKPAYIFTGMLFVPSQHYSQVWTVVAAERGITGVREAVITAELFDAGKLTIEDYERSWAQDPYDPTYCGVDRSVLRFVSDEECYDARFPEHPLSKVRRVLATLPACVVESGH